jgi:hypothetical protein
MRRRSIYLALIPGSGLDPLAKIGIGLWNQKTLIISGPLLRDEVQLRSGTAGP